MFFGGLFFLGLLLFGGMFAVRAAYSRHGCSIGHIVPHDYRHTSTGFTEDEPPLETLRRRYASGEITREQYLQMRRDLEYHPDS